MSTNLFHGLSKLQSLKSVASAHALGSPIVRRQRFSTSHPVLNGKGSRAKPRNVTTRNRLAPMDGSGRPPRPKSPNTRRPGSPNARYDGGANSRQSSAPYSRNDSGPNSRHVGGPPPRRPGLGLPKGGGASGKFSRPSKDGFERSRPSYPESSNDKWKGERSHRRFDDGPAPCETPSRPAWERNPERSFDRRRPDSGSQADSPPKRSSFSSRDAPPRRSSFTPPDAPYRKPSFSSSNSAPPKVSSHRTDLRQKLKSEFIQSEDPAERPALGPGFTSPPLQSGLLESLRGVLGPRPKATPIQSLSMAHFLGSNQRKSGTETLLASETGSGKSIAYLLPVLQSLKEAEMTATQEGSSTKAKPATASPSTSNSGILADEDPEVKAIIPPRVVPGPRAIILCPTHELCRQIAKYAKSLSHNIKLRVVCASNPNKGAKATSDAWDEEESAGIEQSSLATGRPVDILVGTPSKILSLVGGVELSDRTVLGASQRTWDVREKGEWVGKVEGRMSLENVAWLVVDETDVMFDRDFVRTTRAIMDDIAADRAAASNDPVNLVLSSATIPVALSTYLETHHPKMVRLASSRIHRLPKGLITEHVQLTDGNKFSTIYKKIEAVWADDAARRSAKAKTGSNGEKGKIVIFCNEIRNARKLEEYLTAKRVESLVMVGNDDGRLKGSNNHLAGFLNPASVGAVKAPNASNATKELPRVLITTSLLSRGLDFDPTIRHVFVVDEPRSAVDFIHRAGRTGRAGNVGTVVLFEKGSRRERRSAGKTSNIAQTPERFGKLPRRRT